MAQATRKSKTSKSGKSLSTTRGGKVDLGLSLTDGLALIDDVILLLRKNDQTAKTLGDAVRVLRRIAPFSAASLCLMNEETGKLEEIVSVDGSVSSLEFMNLPSGSGLTGVTASTRKPIYLPDRSRMRQFDPEHSYASLLSIPLLAGEKLIGVLNLGDRATNAFTQAQVQLFMAAAMQFAIAIERYVLQQNLHNLEDRLKSAMVKMEALLSQIRALSEIKGDVEQRRFALNDINNALAVILGSIEMLLFQRVAVDQKMLSQLRRSEEAAFRIQKTVNRLSAQFDDSAEVIENPLLGAIIKK